MLLDERNGKVRISLEFRKGLQLGNVLNEQIHHVNEAAQEEEVLEGLHLRRLKQGQKPSPRGERRSPEDVAADLQNMCLDAHDHEWTGRGGSVDS